MRFLVDANVPLSVAPRIRALGTKRLTFVKLRWETQMTG
jgi:hypothetical protein